MMHWVLGDGLLFLWPRSRNCVLLLNMACIIVFLSKWVEPMSNWQSAFTVKYVYRCYCWILQFLLAIVIPNPTITGTTFVFCVACVVHACVHVFVFIVNTCCISCIFVIVSEVLVCIYICLPTNLGSLLIYFNLCFAGATWRELVLPRLHMPDLWSSGQWHWTLKFLCCSEMFTMWQKVYTSFTVLDLFESSLYYFYLKNPNH